MVLGGGCGADAVVERSDPAPLAPALLGRGAEAPSLRIISPLPGEAVRSPVTVEVEVEHLKPMPAGRSRDGEGHAHLVVDGDCLAPGDVFPRDEHHVHFDGPAVVVEVELSPGRHVLCAQFGDGFHSAVAITDVVEVLVID